MIFLRLDLFGFFYLSSLLCNAVISQFLITISTFFWIQLFSLNFKSIWRRRVYINSFETIVSCIVSVVTPVYLFLNYPTNWILSGHFDSGLQVDADCRTNETVYFCRYGDEHIEVDRETYNLECIKSYHDLQKSINSIAQQIQVFDNDFWAHHMVIIVPKGNAVPKRNQSIWERLFNFFF